MGLAVSIFGRSPQPLEHPQMGFVGLRGICGVFHQHHWHSLPALRSSDLELPDAQPGSCET